MTGHHHIAVLAMLAVTAPAVADDFAPPAFRGSPLSVEMEWEWASPPANWLFDVRR